jgi:filamentous hemagglutinin
VTAGNVRLQAERVYPDTFTMFMIQAQSGTASTNVDIDPILVNGKPSVSPGAPLSGGGQLTVEAANIEIGGDLYAPLGTITLTASQSLQLSNGSLLSVSGAGLDIPYGQTVLGGTTWEYLNGLNTITAVPTKGINLTAPNVVLEHSSQVDLQGGGDLYAYEWVPGTGGSVDALASPANGGIAGTLRDFPQTSRARGSLRSAGEPRLQYDEHGVPERRCGCCAGYYALLPPRYALAPGALLIAIEPSYTSATGGQIGCPRQWHAGDRRVFELCGHHAACGSEYLRGLRDLPERLRPAARRVYDQRCIELL